MAKGRREPSSATSQSESSRSCVPSQPLDSSLLAPPRTFFATIGISPLWTDAIYWRVQWPSLNRPRAFRSLEHYISKKVAADFAQTLK